MGPLTHGPTNFGVSCMKSVNIGLQLNGFVSYATGVKISTDDDGRRLGYIFKRGGWGPWGNPLVCGFLGWYCPAPSIFALSV